jgi:uncharacterized repeat protein (TIGR01451 family)
MCGETAYRDRHWFQIKLILVIQFFMILIFLKEREMRNKFAILIGCGTVVLFFSVGFAADDLSPFDTGLPVKSLKRGSVPKTNLTLEEKKSNLDQFDKLLFGELDTGDEESNALPSSARLEKIKKHDFIKKASSRQSKTVTKSKQVKRKKPSLVQAGFEKSTSKKKTGIVQVAGPGDSNSPFSLPDELLTNESEDSDSAEDDDSPLILLLPENKKQAKETVELKNENNELLELSQDKVEVTEEIEEVEEVKTELVRTESASQDFPIVGTGVQNSSVSLQWTKISAVNIGQECKCELVVKNTGKTLVRNIDVDAFFPKTLRLVGVKPQPVDHNDHLTWNFDSLTPGQEERIQIQMIPSQRGDLGTTAFVRYTGAASGAFDVREPKLTLAMKGTDKAIVGELASQIIVVTNEGDGVATDVTVQALIPEGLEHVRGKKLTLELGSLEPGETRNVRLSLEAVQGGDQTIQVKAKANAIPVQTVSANVTVVAPNLQVEVEGPGLRYVGRKAQYKIHASNDGQGISNNVRVIYNIPEGFKFIRADRGGKYDEVSNTVQWFIGRLESEDTRQVRIELLAETPGEFVHQIAALSENGNRAEAELETAVEGTASLVLEIIDLDDPVEVGSETAYEVRIKNEGSAVAKDVALTCEMPEGLSLLEAKGPTDFRNADGNLIFKAVSELRPGKTALYRIHVKGSEAGNKRFRVKLMSESIDEPLIFEELTKFYEE